VCLQEGRRLERAAQEIMNVRSMVLIGALLYVATAADAKGHSRVEETQFPSTYIPSGKTMFKQYCSACHGVDGKGGGPAASMLKLPPPDLTTLAKRHGGKFPYEYASSILRFGPGVAAHGSSDMPHGVPYSILWTSTMSALWSNALITSTVIWPLCRSGPSLAETTHPPANSDEPGGLDGSLQHLLKVFL
jgi:mono/diheme cytochrome c family protein